MAFGLIILAGSGGLSCRTCRCPAYGFHARLSAGEPFAGVELLHAPSPPDVPESLRQGRRAARFGKFPAEPVGLPPGGGEILGYCRPPYHYLYNDPCDRRGTGF